MAKQQKERETLHHNRLYLHMALSLNQAFVDKQLDELKRVVVDLHGK